MNLVNKKILFIETFPDTPLIDTACELALTLKKRNSINFFWCGYNLPWKDWQLNIFKRMIGFSFDKKIKIIKEILKNNCIKVNEEILLEKKKINYINKWASNYDKNKNLKKYFYKEKNIKANLGISVESSLLSIYKNYDFREDLNKIRAALTSSAIVFNRSLKIIEKIKPDVIITFNNRFSISRPIIEAAKISKVKIIRHEVGSSYNKYEIFSHDVHDINERCKIINKYWNTTDKFKRLKNARKFFLSPFKKTKTINTGSGKIASFSLNQTKKIYLPKNKKIITFFTSSNYEYDAISADFSYIAKGKDFKDQTSALNSLVSVFKKLDNYLLIIRVHPSHKNGHFENSYWLKYSSNKIIVIKSESPVNSFYLIKKSDYIVTYGSTLAVHAAYHNKPSISLRKHVFSCSGIFIEPKNKKELLKVLKKKYRLNTRKKCLPYGNYIFSFGKKFKYFKRDNIRKGYIKKITVNHFGFVVNQLINIFYPVMRFLKKNVIN